MSIVSFNNVFLQKKDEKGQDVQILQDLNFTVSTGAIFAVAGPSGSGKSSALRLINRLDDSDSGQVIVQGREIWDWDIQELRAKVGFMFQEAALFEGSVKENLLYAPCLQGLRKCDHESTALELLDSVGLTEELLHRNVESLSGGQKQRVNLARTLAMDPEIILMDEPTSSLDPAATRMIESLILQLNEQGRTFILVSHNLDQIERIATACVVLDGGRGIFAGTTAELLSDRETLDILTKGKEEEKDD